MTILRKYKKHESTIYCIEFYFEYSTTKDILNALLEKNNNENVYEFDEKHQVKNEKEKKLIKNNGNSIFKNNRFIGLSKDTIMEFALLVYCIFMIFSMTYVIFKREDKYHLISFLLFNFIIAVVLVKVSAIKVLHF
ncbi:hypothetical protein PIROE2DRAFT_12679 [Piromyces sp. E2]|nr:hypothetical protein PIROE2DRAFT_12679 [Piromyces sp. E2]|eukprot:OUM61338.1 hypothetical protein PIROE2DRAFT_12679 [Piromyces sp. E2]